MSKLYDAIMAKDVKLVDKILMEEPTLIDEKIDGHIPMSFAAAGTGDLEVVKYIVEYSRASFNEFDGNHRDVLHYAAQSGNVELCKYLVERVGMTPVVGDTNLVTAYDIAKAEGHTELCEYFAKVCGAKLEDMYRNPIRSGMFPDPSICRVGEDYYMANSSFVFFPCIPISHSKDLIHWEIIGHAITNPEWAYVDELEGGRGYWAPDISYYKGKFYICATYRLNDTGTVYRKQMVVSSDKPEGPYSKPIFLDEDGIDPSIFNDDDGRRYMLLNRGARIFEINEDATEQIGKAELLFYGDQKRAPEGPHLLKKDGFYYLFEAEGGTGPGHRITVSRSTELFGVYEPCPYNPIMRQEDPLAPIQRCGHGKPVMTQNGEWYMVYLCGRQIDGQYSMLGRETALDPITWTADGWPLVNMRKGPSCIQKKPNLPEVVLENDTALDLSKEVLAPIWVTPRVPEEGAIQIKNNTLYLKGSTAPLSSVDSRNILVRRQTDFAFTAEAAFCLQEMQVGQQEGMVCYYDENTWVTFGVHKTSDGYVVKAWEHIGTEDIEHEEISVSALDQLITYRVETSYLKRSFSYKIGEGAWMPYKTLENVYYICDEGVKMGKRFTGAMIGMYAYAGETPYTAQIKGFEYIKK